MPDRIIRCELLESEPWLELKDNADRSAWIAAALTVDNFGDMPAGAARLCRLWRPYGIDTAAKAMHTFSNLADVDLVRGYDVNLKPYMHIPRFGQRLRWVGIAYPLSPWATDEEKQLYVKKYPAERRPSPENRREPPATTGEPPAEVSTREEKKILKPSGDLLSADTPLALFSGFDRFWAAYPNLGRRKDKKKCLALWRKKSCEQIADVIVAHVVAMAKTVQWRVDVQGKHFEPLTSTYLGGEHWHDGLPESVKLRAVE